jgi:hypothetical protein
MSLFLIKFAYTFEPEIKQLANVDHTAVDLRALNDWVSIVCSGESVTIGHISNVLDITVATIKMLPPKDRHNLPLLLLKFYGKRCPKNVMSFLRIFYALILGKEMVIFDWDAFLLVAALDPTEESLSKICLFLDDSISWFSNDAGKKPKGSLHKLKDSLESNDRSKGKKNAVDSLFKVSLRVAGVNALGPVDTRYTAHLLTFQVV